MFIFNMLGRFFPSFHFLCCIQRNPSRLTSKQLGRKDFSIKQLSIDSYMLLNKRKKRILFQLINKSLVFNLIQLIMKFILETGQNNEY